MNQIAPFEASAPARPASQATLVEQSRAVAEVQASVVVAMRQPRDVQAAIAEMRQVCRIQEMAERAFFRFNRGGQVTGETVHLARELARIWGNINFGLVELSRDDANRTSEMMAYAWDLQTNARAQTTFIVPHVRDTKGGAKPLTDVRDIYENNANMGARRLREQIFAVLPVWFREEAAALCQDTLEKGGDKPLPTRIADCEAAFASINITRAQMEKRQGRPAAQWTAQDVAALRVVFTSIKRGEVQAAEEFPPDALAPPPGADPLEQASAGQAPATSPPAAADPIEAITNPDARDGVRKLLKALAGKRTAADVDALAMDAQDNITWLAEHHPEAAAAVRKAIGDRRAALLAA